MLTSVHIFVVRTILYLVVRVLLFDACALLTVVVAAILVEPLLLPILHCFIKLLAVVQLLQLNSCCVACC